MTELAPRPPAQSLTVVVADRHPTTLAAVAEFIETRGIVVAGRAQDGHVARALIEQLKPTVALIDPRLTGTDGIAITAAIRTTAPRTSVIVYAEPGDRDLLVDSLEAGARGFLLRDTPLRDVVRAIEMVCDGRYSVGVRALGLLDENRGLSRAARLSRRERELLRLVVNGVRSTDLRRDVSTARDLGRELTRAVAKLEGERIRFISRATLPNATNGA